MVLSGDGVRHVRFAVDEVLERCIDGVRGDGVRSTGVDAHLDVFLMFQRGVVL